MHPIHPRTFAALTLSIVCWLTTAGAAAAFPADQPVDEAEAEAGRRVAEAFVESVRAGTVDAASSRVDWAGILVKATRGVPAAGPGSELRKEFVDKFLEDLGETGGLVAQVAEVVKQGGSYAFLRMPEQQPLRAIVRLLPPGGGVNYHTLYLARSETGSLRIVDIGVAVSGERLSETLRRGFLALVAGAEEDWSPLFEEREQQYLKHLTDLRAMAEALSQQELGRVDGLFGELPLVLQRDHSVQMLRLQTALARGETEFSGALTRFRGMFPDSLAGELFAVNAWLQLERPAGALEAIDRIETAVGGDPYLHVMRADVHYRAGELAAAERASRAAIKDDPDLQDAYWQLTTISLDQRNFATTAEMLTQIADRFGVEFQDLRDVPEYNEFVQSPEYRAWRRSRPR